MDNELEWLVRSIERVNQWDRRPGRGITRLAYSKEDLRARQWLESQCRELEMDVRLDCYGNFIGRWPGNDPEAPVVMAGSHMDTVPQGGAYDGVLGVLTALAVIRRLRRQGVVLPCAIEVVSFVAEESSRFGVATLGSKLMANLVGPSILKRFQDSDGVSAQDALDRMDETLKNKPDTLWNPSEVKAFVELHIEQGPLLEHEKVDIGIVQAIAAPSRYRMEFTGEPAHSGACPMHLRKDALLAAAEVALAVEAAGLAEAKAGTVGTVGNIQVTPGVMNVVPGHAQILIDLRGVEAHSLDKAAKYVLHRAAEVCHKRGVFLQTTVLAEEKPTHLHNGLVSLIERTLQTSGLSTLRMNSGAGHDAMNMAAVVPASLLFIPCHQGISHHPDEQVRIKDISNGLDALYATLFALASDGCRL